jgi:hypothetical protein
VSPSARSVRPAAGYVIRCAWCGDVMRLTTNVFYKFFFGGWMWRKLADVSDRHCHRIQEC